MARRPVSGDAAMYWSQRIGKPLGELHPTVDQACRISPSLCERAWADLQDKKYHADNPDLTMARRVENEQAFFVHRLKIYIREAGEAHARKLAEKRK